MLKEHLSSQSRALIFGLCAVACWSTVATAFKLSLRYVNPLQLILIASVTTLIFLLVVLVIQGRFKELFQQDFQTYLRSFSFGLINPLLYYVLLFSAYDLLPAQEAQALNYSWAIVLSLLAVPMLKQRLTLGDILAAALCYGGVIIIATRGDVFSLNFAQPTGVFYALASTVIWSLYWIYNRRDQREPVLGLCMNFLFAVPIILIYTAFSGDLSKLVTTLQWPGLLGGVYVGLFEMGIAFVCWLMAMKHASNTAQIANLVFLSPFISLLLIYLVLGENIAGSTIVGLVLIIFGLIVQQWWQSRIQEA